MGSRQLALVIRRFHDNILILYELLLGYLDYNLRSMESHNTAERLLRWLISAIARRIAQRVRVCSLKRHLSSTWRDSTS